MIVEVVAVSLTVCFVATLRFAKWASEREERLAVPTTRRAIKEKRRVLERDRQEWKLALGAGERIHVTSKQGAAATKNMALIDAKLLALADEETKISDDE